MGIALGGRKGFTLGLEDTHSRKFPGQTLWCLMACVSKDGCTVRLPDAALMHLLAKRHLDVEYEEKDRLGAQSISFLIPSRVSREDREIFVWYVYHNTQLVKLSMQTKNKVA